MKKNFLKFLSIAVITIGLLNCGGPSNPLIKEAQDGINAGNYEAALASLDQAIEQDSASADAYYYKGVVYSEMAQNNSDVGDRKDSYTTMRTNLLKANDLYQSQGAKSLESVESQLLLDRNWGREHNMGVKYAQQDSSLPPTDNYFDISEDHFENAIIINPDSLISFEVLGEVYRLNSKVEEAIQTYNKIIDKRDSPEAFDYDRLGSLYLQNGEFDKATSILEKGLEVFPDSVSLVQKLADAYMNSGQNQKSITVIESLIERDPDNPQYHLVLGTQVYIMADDINESISSKYDQIFNLERDARDLRGQEKTDAENKIKELRSEIENQSKEAEELTEKAIQEIKLVTELRPNDASAFNTLGIIYQNRAAALFEKRNDTEDNDEAAKIDTQAKDNLRLAMENYEKATEIEPDNKKYWTGLFEVYTALGMNEKAEAAMEKAGM